MCHSDRARPPTPPCVTPTSDHGPLTLTTADGIRFPSYEAHPAQPSTRGIVILPDVRGAHAYYQDLAVRFAEAGMHAVVSDYYGHLTDDPSRNDDFDWQQKLPRVDAATVRPVVAAAITQLRTSGASGLFSVGFCFGGSQSWLLSAAELPLDGVIGFYGNPDLVAPRVGELRRPMLLLAAGADVATSRQKSEDFEDLLTRHGVPHLQKIYEGAPHSFFDRAGHEWAEACDDAWRQILAFIAAHTTEPASPQPDEDPRADIYSRLVPFLPDLPELARQFAHDTIGRRPGLTREQRELVILGALITLGDTGPQLTAHARAAIAAGLTGEQLGEIILQAVPYAGFPRAINAALALETHLRSTPATPSD